MFWCVYADHLDGCYSLLGCNRTEWLLWIMQPVSACLRLRRAIKDSHNRTKLLLYDADAEEAEPTVSEEPSLVVGLIRVQS